MKRSLIIIISALFALSSKAQETSDFEKFGKLVFNKLIVEEHYNEVSIIWIDQYKNFIDSQEGLSDSEKEKQKYEVDRNYTEWYKKYQDSYLYFEQSYNQAKLKGAQFEYLGAEWTEKSDDKYEDTYHFEVSFIYKSETVQNKVSITFEAAWFQGSFVVLSEFREDF